MLNYGALGFYLLAAQSQISNNLIWLHRHLLCMCACLCASERIHLRFFQYIKGKKNTFCHFHKCLRLCRKRCCGDNIFWAHYHRCCDPSVIAVFLLGAHALSSRFLWTYLTRFYSHPLVCSARHSIPAKANAKNHNGWQTIKTDIQYIFTTSASAMRADWRRVMIMMMLVHPIEWPLNVFTTFEWTRKYKHDGHFTETLPLMLSATCRCLFLYISSAAFCCVWLSYACFG